MAILGAALVGCGSSERDAGSGGGEKATPTAIAPGPASEEESQAEGGRRPADPSVAGGRNRSERSSKPAFRADDRSPSRVNRDVVRRDSAKARPACPVALERKECKARIEAESGRPPSHPVTEPQDCLEVMSKEQCEEILAAQRGAEARAGRSIDPDTCLQDYPREYCEAQLAPHYEQQHAASQEAGE